MAAHTFNIKHIINIISIIVFIMIARHTEAYGNVMLPICQRAVMYVDLTPVSSFKSSGLLC